MLGSGAKYNRNITTNERAASVTLFHLIPEMTYGVKVAARSNAGVGVYHGLEAVTMSKLFNYEKERRFLLVKILHC